MKNKTPWLDSQGRFEVKTCVSARKYIAHKTGLKEKDIEVHKTDRRLIVNATINGQLRTATVEGPFLYTMFESDFEPAIKVLTADQESKQA